MNAPKPLLRIMSVITWMVTAALFASGIYLIYQAATLENPIAKYHWLVLSLFSALHIGTSIALFVLRKRWGTELYMLVSIGIAGCLAAPLFNMLSFEMQNNVLYGIFTVAFSGLGLAWVYEVTKRRKKVT